MAGPADFYLPGAHNSICDRTGFKVKSTGTRKEWTNSIVRSKSFELRQPQDFLRSKVDRQAVPNPRSEASTTFLGINEAKDALTDPDEGTKSASAVADGGNTGDGTFTGLVADLSADSSYTLSITRVTIASAGDQDPGDKGEWRLVDSNSKFVAVGGIGVAFAGGGLCFTLNEDGSTAFVVGDSFTITVT